jgi:hypothetical protein
MLPYEILLEFFLSLVLIGFPRPWLVALTQIILLVEMVRKKKNKILSKKKIL